MISQPGPPGPPGPPGMPGSILWSHGECVKMYQSLNVVSGDIQ